MNSTAIVTGFRKALSELLVPEVKVIQLEIKSQSDVRFEAMLKDIKTSRITIEKKLDKLLDQDKRLTRLETMLNQIIKKEDVKLISILRIA